MPHANCDGCCGDINLQSECACRVLCAREINDSKCESSCIVGDQTCLHGCCGTVNVQSFLQKLKQVLD
jgi:hypothetical protein